MDFEILIDSSFATISSDLSLEPVENKKVMSLVNDFEDGEWRYKKFQNFIWDNIVETALSAQERECLIDQSHSLLTEAAKNLRLTDSGTQDISKGSELAEIVLYGIMKHYYSALPVVPKIFYKQNAQDNAKGADSVHIVLEGEDDFSLWFGEAKFYNSIEDARLSSIITSVGNSLKTDKLKKENSIITNVGDLDSLIDNNTLKTAIKSALSPRNSIDNIKHKIHIPIFILHECSITSSTDTVDDDYRENIKSHHIDRANAYFKKQISKIGKTHKYSSLHFHIILFPVPNKKAIVDKFTTAAEFYKEQ